GESHDGAIMAVPAHDVDLWELARRLRLPIREVVHGDKANFDSQGRLEEPWLGVGVLPTSGPPTSLASKVGRDRIIAGLSKKGVCKKASRFLLSRVSAASPAPWGPPVPIIHCKRCGAVAVPDADLPVELPEEASGRPMLDDGALASVKTFQRAPCPVCKESAIRDADTIAPWLGSAWMHIRLVLP